MVASVSSPVQQPLPAANTFQPGGTEANRRIDGDKSFRPPVDELNQLDSGRVSSSASRGANLDITA